MTTAQTYEMPQVSLEEQVQQRFMRITRNHSLFHIFFFCLGVTELLAFVLFFSFFTKTAIFAFTLAGIFLSIFTYFVLSFYLQAKKPEQLMQLRNAFIAACTPHLSKEAPHVSLSEALYSLISSLEGIEYEYYILPSYFETLSHLFTKFSVWVHWKDAHQMKELLYLMIVREYVELVKEHPTGLEAHARLATAFYSLSQLYFDPRKKTPQEDLIWVSPAYGSKEIVEKYQKAAARAIEELHILNAFAPNDPWVHAQLASIYKDLEMPNEEMRHYEALLKISPKDENVLLQLGTLYFKNSLTAHALQLYEQLKNINPEKAEELISHYGAALLVIDL